MANEAVLGNHTAGNPDLSEEPVAGEEASVNCLTLGQCKALCALWTHLFRHDDQTVHPSCPCCACSVGAGQYHAERAHGQKAVMFGGIALMQLLQFGFWM